MTLYPDPSNNRSCKSTDNTCSDGKTLESQGCDSSGLSALQITLNTIDEPVYIVDVESYKVLFANRKIEALFGPIQGEFCWEKLHKGQTAPCDFCTNKYLINKEGAPSGVCHLTYKNQMTGKWLQCSDQALRWFDGRMVAIKTAVDVSSLKKSLLSSETLLKQNQKLSQRLVTSIDDERREISRNLHDELGQIGTAVRLNADFLMRTAKSTGALSDQIDAVKDIIKLSDQFLRITKGISVSLNPRGIIFHQSLHEMLEDQFSEWRRRKRNIMGDIVFNFDLSLDLDIKLKEVLYRVMQEALTNISRHSEATYVSVVCSSSKVNSIAQEDLLMSESTVELTIHDNGIGLPSNRGNFSLGLLYMKERLTALNGSLEIESPPAGGLRLQVKLPYTRLNK